MRLFLELAALGLFTVACLLPFIFRGQGQRFGWPKAWKAVATRYRRWFLAELAGNLHNKRDRDQKAMALWLTGRCLFCNQEFRHGETVVWLPAHRRAYCFECRDSIDAEERDEAEREAKAGEYVTHGVAKGGFYRGR